MNSNVHYAGSLTPSRHALNAAAAQAADRAICSWTAASIAIVALLAVAL